MLNRNLAFENFNNNYDRVIIDSVYCTVRSMKKYSELVNLCILWSLEKVILENCFKIL